MKQQRPYVLSIAGYDPSAGAGVTADIKTFEQNGVYGFGVITAVTGQNDISFKWIEWLPFHKIINQLKPLLERFPIEYIKIGLTENIAVLQQVIDYLHQHIESPKIILDPVLKASAGFVFHKTEQDHFQQLLPKLFCITPNIPEAEQIFGKEHLPGKLAMYCHDAAIYLKGGHSESDIVTDMLFYKDTIETFTNPRLPKGEKHGSGCVLSAALTAQLASGRDLKAAAMLANRHTQQFLASNETRLGYHSEISIQ